MKKDMHAVIRKTAKFLGKEINDDQIVQLSDHLSFEKMKNNPAVNFEDHINMLKDMGLGDKNGTFMRNGQVDQWKTKWSQDLIQRFDLWTKDHLEGTGLSY
uniref:Sulfotransferase domain-containing protein n=2 Tax=Graphocephala atropunctata TaxID=36148 RepID=A0A1B6MHB2_9HEMI